jgi:hypothetical protein
VVSTVERDASSGTITVTIKQLGSGAGVELHGHNGFEVLNAGVWEPVSITSHAHDAVTLSGNKAISTGERLRYSWYSNPCGLRPFGCAVYVSTKPLVPGLSGEEPFLPLPPFIVDL